jgi:CheY-like chemotaxis protein
VANLSSNAVKFTDAGQVTVRTTLTPRRRDVGVADLVVSVCDTGPGFDETVKARLFRRFEQADNSVARRYGGAGLGLSICRELAERMGGRIECESEPGSGSVFTLHLTLPLAAEPEAGDQGEGPAGLLDDGRRRRVLLAEDHLVNQRVVQAILGGLVDLTVVENGASALEAWAAGDFDLVLMDTQMPVMDGLAAIRRIRAEERSIGRPPIAIISLSADAMPQHVQEALAAGADRHLAKPITAAALIAALSSVLATQLAAAGAVAAPAAPAARADGLG